MNWKEVSVLTEGACAEAVAGIFHRLGSGGVVIEDPQAARQYVKKEIFDASTLSPDFLEHSFVVIKAYFHEDRQIMEELNNSLEQVNQCFKTQCRVFIDEVRDEDWEESWKKYYHTFKVGNRLVIKPSWENYQAKEDEEIIEIDPGMAFGTGIHASTRFCLKFIEKYIKGGETVIDAGCGSGILSIAAAKLGARKITAIEIDDVAVKVAKENVMLNRLEEIIEVKAGDATEELNTHKADVILANITADVINLLIPHAAQSLEKGGWLFASGIVDSRFPGVQKQLQAYGFSQEEVLTDVDWVGVAAQKA
ncbi:MAG TPA: 50S ribosomal protein L11 methyltransferase [Syntrophomonadaceae bacterium]|nr:50S ribosomal protein L11 methyltransferase [Syntrophomonadaceae bacterium]HRX20094.1 50S ribosomal protein L11 methyltransferase [Syntrophomonadaceae bacterium]